jgi:hypothetical protein
MGGWRLTEAGRAFLSGLISAGSPAAATQPDEPPPPRDISLITNSVPVSLPDHQNISWVLPDPKIDVGRVLAVTAGLFGERVTGRPEQYPDGRLLLGTIAAAYDNRRRLDKPEALEWFRKLMLFNVDQFGWMIHHEYLEDCDLVRCDLAAGEFVLSAEDQLSADWLNARLIAKPQNMLAEICGRQLKVRFEVWPPQREASSQRSGGTLSS